jgi:glycosyltransferase involved in cell wall biosynthesis
LERLHTQGYRILVLPMALNGHFHLHFYPGLGEILTRLKPEILHIDEEPYNLATLQAMRLGARLGAKCLFFTWQNLLRNYPFPFSSVERYNYTHADYAIVGNGEGEMVLRAKGYHGPVAVIPQFGVDPQTYKPSGRKERRPFTVGYVGRLVEEKGVDILLQAMAGVGGDWRLRILGSGPTSRSLKDLSHRLHSEEKVTFEEPIPSNQMPAYYGDLDLLVLPSRTRPNWKEQFGRVLIEAMASGVPVLGSDCGEIPNLIGKAGLIFPEGNIESLREAIQRIMKQEPLRQHFTRAGRERILEHYTQESVASQTYEVYEQML